MGVLSGFCSNPRPTHVEFVKHVLQYVSGTLELSLKSDREVDTPDDVNGYTDFDFAGSKPDQKSTGGYFFMLARAAISHSSKLQSIVALSIYKAKYFAMCEVEKRQSGWDICWLGWDFGKGLPRSHYTLTIKAQSRCQITLNFTVVQKILMCNFTEFEKKYQ